jgi:hypothetical protein
MKYLLVATALFLPASVLNTEQRVSLTTRNVPPSPFLGDVVAPTKPRNP